MKKLRGGATAAAAVLSALGKEALAAPSPSHLSVAAPLQRDVVTGERRLIQETRVVPRVSGVVREVAVPDGGRVGKGEVLFVLDPAPFHAALAVARAEVARATVTLADAHAALGQVKKAGAARLTDSDDHATRLATFRLAGDALAQARAVERARLRDLGRTVVRAPVAGYVSSDRVGIGDYVLAGQTVLTGIARPAG